MGRIFVQVCLVVCLVVLMACVGCGKDTTPPSASDNDSIEAVDTTPPNASDNDTVEAVDRTPPTVVAGIAVSTPPSDNTPTFVWNAATDAESGIDYYRVTVDHGDSLDVGNVNTCTWTAALADGNHTVGVEAVDRAGNQGNTGILAFTVDAIPPIISNVTASVTASSAIICWTTSDPATSQVEYGPDAFYGFATELDSGLVTSHHVSITGLQPNHVYHYRVKSTDAQASVSEDYILTTRKSTVEVGGVIAKDTTWTSDVDYIATGNVGVEEGATLTIEPGTHVAFKENCGLQVMGKLRAEGHADDVIVLTSASGLWTGVQVIRVQTGNAVTLSYCVIEEAAVGIDLGYNSSANEITHNVIRDCGTGIAWQGHSSIDKGQINDNEISGNYTGIWADSSPADITHNAIKENAVGIELASSASTVMYNTIEDNDVGILARGENIAVQSNNFEANRTFSLKLTTSHEEVNATGNWWGSTDESAIQHSIYDYYDDLTVEKVIYEPYATARIAGAP